MWIIAIVILLFCFHEVFGKPIIWLALGVIAGYFIGKHKVPEQLKQKYEEFKQTSDQSTDATYYKRLAQEMMEENIKLRNHVK